MNTPSQQALAAFIDSFPELKWEYKTKKDWRGSWLPGQNFQGKPSAYAINCGQNYEIRLVVGQLNEFGIPHSLAHLQANPAGLTAEQITEGGKWRVALKPELADYPHEVWDAPSNSWKSGYETSKYTFGDCCLTYRLPALHPLPKVECDELTEEQMAEYAKRDQEALEEEYSKPKSEREPGTYAPDMLEAHWSDESTLEIASALSGEKISDVGDIPYYTPPQAEVKQNDTPRTDAEFKSYETYTNDHFGYAAVRVQFARTLERELTAERKRAEEAEAQIVALRAAFKISLVRAYTIGEAGGHHSTVDGSYIDVLHKDETTYYLDYVETLLADGSLPEAQAALSAQPPAVKEDEG